MFERMQVWRVGGRLSPIQKFVLNSESHERATAFAASASFSREIGWCICYPGAYWLRTRSPVVEAHFGEYGPQAERPKNVVKYSTCRCRQGVSATAVAGTESCTVEWKSMLK